MEPCAWCSKVKLFPVHETQLNIFLLDIFVVLEQFLPMDFFCAFEVPIWVDSDKTKPAYLLLLVYLAIHQKKTAPNSRFKNSDFWSGGAKTTTTSINLRFVEFSRISLTGLSVLLRDLMVSSLFS